MSKIPIFLIFILLLISTSISVYAQSIDNGGFIVTHNNAQDNSGILTDNIISESWISFEQLPLWIQIAYIMATALGILSIFKLFPFVFGRLKHALENQKTKELFYFIQRNPGMTIAELSEEQNMNRGTLKYHLSQLMTNNKVVFIKEGKFSRLFYNNSSAQDKENIISRYLRNDNSRDILFTIMDMPGVTNQELSSRFDLAKSTTHEYLKSLSEDGIVEFRQDGRFKRCYVQQDARMILLRFRPQ